MKNWSVRSMASWSLVAFLVAFLAACGSGGGSAESLPPLPPLPVAPAITSQPVGAGVTAGNTASFMVVATGTVPQYQWRKNGTDITGAVQASYSFITTLADNDAQFSVRVSNLAGQVVSNTVTLRVTPVLVAPVIASQPTALGVVAGQPAAFSVVATGTDLQFQWRRNGIDIAGAVQTTYSFTTSLSDNGAQFSVRVGNMAGQVVSDTVPLRVSPQFVPVSIAVQPLDITVRAGQEAAFSLVLGGTGPFTWSWFRDGVNTQLGVFNTFVNTPSFVFTPAVLGDNGALISLQVTDPSGTVISRQARLTVLP